MVVEQKQDIGYQLHLGFSSDKESVRHLKVSEAVSQAEYRKVLQTNVAGEQERALTHHERLNNLRKPPCARACTVV